MKRFTGLTLYGNQMLTNGKLMVTLSGWPDKLFRLWDVPGADSKCLLLKSVKTAVSASHQWCVDWDAGAIYICTRSWPDHQGLRKFSFPGGELREVDIKFSSPNLITHMFSLTRLPSGSSSATETTKPRFRCCSVPT